MNGSQKLNTVTFILSVLLTPFTKTMIGYWFAATGGDPILDAVAAVKAAKPAVVLFLDFETMLAVFDTFPASSPSPEDIVDIARINLK